MLSNDALNKLMRHAAANEEPPESLECPEEKLWWRMHKLYTDADAGKIAVAEAKAEKERLIVVYRKDREKWEGNAGYEKFTAEFYQRTEGPRRRYAKSGNRTPEADELYYSIDGLRPGRREAVNGQV